MAIGRPHPILVPSGLPMPEPMSGPSMQERHDVPVVRGRSG